MEFQLTIEQRLIQKVARDFAQTEIEPIAAQVDRDKKIPSDMARKMAKVRLLGMVIPEQYGGSGAGYLNWILALEQLNYPVSSCSVFANMTNMVGGAIAEFGTEEQKQRYLKLICDGELIASWVFTEPATGSDPLSLVTRAKLEGDCWVINGTKRFHTLGHLDGPAVIFANVEGRKTTAFIVEKNIEGYACSKPFELMGNHGLETVDTSLHNVRIPKSNLFGEVGKGFDIMLRVAAVGRLSLSIKSVAMAQAALDEAVKYAKQRTRRGVPIASMQAIQWMLAEMAVRVEAARWMTYRAAFLKEQGEDISKESAMNKLFASRVAKEVADMSMQVHGSYGFTKDFKIERIYRDAKENELIEGSSEIQRSIIARYLVA